MESEKDRVRRHTARSVLRRIDDGTAARLLECAEGGDEAARRRLQELDREWDTDRTIEVEAATTALAGLALGALVDRRLFAVSGMVAAALLLHGLTGWYPLLPALRRLGVRSALEIERERYALKALRGDFAGLEDIDTRRAIAPGEVAPKAELH